MRFSPFGFSSFLFSSAAVSLAVSYTWRIHRSRLLRYGTPGQAAGVTPPVATPSSPRASTASAMPPAAASCPVPIGSRARR